MKSSSFHWTGHFRLLDIFGNVLVEAFEADQELQLFNICTPPRSSIDVGAFRLAAPVSGPGLSASEPVKIRFRNFGLTPQTNIELSYRLNGGAWKSETFTGTLAAGSTTDYTFSGTEDLSIVGSNYFFDLKATVNGDQRPDNDTTHAVVKNRANRDLQIVGVQPTQACGNPGSALLGAFIRNNGLGEEFTFDVEITANGSPQPNLPVTLFLPPDQQTQIQVFVQNLQSGQNTVELNITNVQGQGEDEFPGNDGGSTTFTLVPDGFPIQLAFSNNEDPEQNYWQVKDDQNNVVASGGPYATEFSFFSQELCLEKDKCYSFHLFDTGGNGMEGGIVELYSPFGGSIWSYFGGNFGSELVANFCAEDQCSTFITDAMVECPSPTNGKITLIPSGGTPPYQFSLNGGNFQTDPVFANLNAGIYFVFATDANNCTYQTEVDLCTVSTSEPEANRRLIAYPNPTSGIAQIELPALSEEQFVLCEVLDLKGKLIQQARLVRWDQTLKGMIFLDNQPSGVYFARVRAGNRAYVAKVVRK
ncbi:MAG: T9SS type A sorting domain-containing protein [Saprospiraceae bacterium]|nr:T9SS type A sorting domain-containing protein [Saprospiraceae bacterium]